MGGNNADQNSHTPTPKSEKNSAVKHIHSNPHEQLSPKEMEEDEGIEEVLEEEILGEKISDDVEDSDISEPTPFDSENEKG